ncbi:MAG TPA: glycosyltransferase [Rudaea sp.]|nr:glycosyltransferase [Rudaea sp.]
MRDDVLRLLVLTDTAILGAGGSERFLRNLLTRLPPDRYSVDVLQLTEEPTFASRVATIDSPAVRLAYHPIGAVYGWRGISAWRRTRDQVRRVNYHVIQSQHEKSDLISALLPRRAGQHKISNRRDMGFQKSARVGAAFRRLNSRFDRIIAPTQSIIDKLVSDENADSTRCRTISNGVDTTIFQNADADRRRRLRTSLGFTNDDWLIGCVASFTPVKRHVDLIDAFADVHAAFPNARLVLIGDGPLRDAIQRQIAKHGLTDYVSFLGKRSDVDQILPALDVFALASNTEGLSNAILEAQACGLPIVATDVGGNPDLVRPGETGWLVPAENSRSLATALKEAASQQQRAKQMGANARARVQQDYSVDAMAASYEKLYRELAHAG